MKPQHFRTGCVGEETKAQKPPEGGGRVKPNQEKWWGIIIKYNSN